MMRPSAPERDAESQWAEENEENEETFSGSFSKKTPPKKTTISHWRNHYTFRLVVADNCRAAGRVCAFALRLTKKSFSDAQFTPELLELIEKTFRGVHVLAHLKREELNEISNQTDFRRAAEAVQIAQSQILDPREIG